MRAAHGFASKNYVPKSLRKLRLTVAHYFQKNLARGAPLCACCAVFTVLLSKNLACGASTSASMRVRARSLQKPTTPNRLESFCPTSTVLISKISRLRRVTMRAAHGRQKTTPSHRLQSFVLQYTTFNKISSAAACMRALPFFLGLLSFALVCSHRA